MMKIFQRSIAQLINGSKTGNYLKYAIGEIILVMIGILLALQVNNWNTERTKDRKELHYLKRLHKDLEKDSSILNNHFKTLKIKSEILISIMNGDLDWVQYSDPSYPMQNIFATRSIQPAYVNRTTFDDLLSTGNMDLIKDAELREQIIEYYNTTDWQERKLANNLSQWPNIISEMIPGEMGLYARPGLKEPSKEQIKQLKMNLKLNLEKLKPIINAELNHTGLQYTYNQIAERLCIDLMSELSNNFPD